MEGDRCRRTTCAGKWWAIAAGALGVLLLGLAAFNYGRLYCCAPIQLTLSGGNVCSLRSEMAQRMATVVHNSDVDLEVAPGANSESICEAVNDGRLDLGLVLGGLPLEGQENVRQVASFGVELLHRVVLDERRTNGAMLTEDLLRLAGLHATTPPQAVCFGGCRRAHTRAATGKRRLTISLKRRREAARRRRR